MPSEIFNAIISVIILASCMFALYCALAPIVTIEEDKHDDLES
jgi:hypothetical protein